MVDHSHLQPKVDNGDFGVLRATGARGIWIKLKAPDEGSHGGHDLDGYSHGGHDLDGYSHGGHDLDGYSHDVHDLDGHLHQNPVASFTL